MLLLVVGAVTLFVASKLYEVNDTILMFVYIFYCIVLSFCLFFHVSFLPCY